MKKTQTHIMYGFVTGLIMIAINAAMVVGKLSFNPKTQWIGLIAYAVFLGGLIMNAMAFSKANNEDITFGQAFSSCFKATAIIAIVCTAWALLSLVIFPNMETEMIELTRRKLIEQGKVSEDQIETIMSMTRKMFKVSLIAGAVFGTMILGALFSLIAAAVAKKNPQPVYEG
jgi:hypothetical protein